MNLGPDLITLLRDTMCLPPGSLKEFKEMRFMDQKTLGSEYVFNGDQETLNQLNKKVTEQQEILNKQETEIR
jgi:hypothetical protein